MHNAGKKESEVGKTQFDIHKTLILLKPDTIARGIVGDIISRLETKSLKIVGMKFIVMSESLLIEHYGHHSEKPYFPKIVKYMTDGPVLAMVVEGIDAVRQVRNLCGATDPQFAAPGTIRGDFCIEVGRNICHGSDSVENAEREIGLWFEDGEVLSWESHSKDWIYE